MLAQTPPMGWNSWNTFGPDINEQVVLETADALVETGLRAAGYDYVVIDDCWSLRERDPQGRLVADPAKFPRGMKFLADAMHQKGLKFGMYSCAGTRTCAGYPSSFDREFVDAQTFADFGVDFLKYDFCNKPRHSTGPLLYHRMALALKATGREILFSACNWGSNQVETWARAAGAHMYRSTGDICDNFQSMSDIARSQVGLLPFSGSGCWNDIDMLVCGMRNKGNVAAGGMTDEEYLFHFALWCVIQSPLMIGCDLRAVDEITLQTLKHPALIRINQDAEARPFFQIGGKENPGHQLLGFKHLENNEFLLAAFNFDTQPARPWVEFFDLGLPAASGYGLRLTDVMTGESLGIKRDYLGFHLPEHGFRLCRGTLAKA